MTTPERIGPYTLVRLLGTGGMAQVFVAVQRGPDGFERQVCVKLMLPQVATDPEFRELFLNEACITGGLSHTNLVQVYDYLNDEQGHLALVMELVEGLDLRTLIRARRARHEVLPEPVVVYLATQMLTGLRYAHNHRVVHGDISPHNLLLSVEGEVKVSDFGVARALVSHATRTGQIRGKLAYMAPEQIRGFRSDHRSDLYAVGLVLYEALRGRRFLNAKSQAELIGQVAHPPRDIRLDGVSPAFVEVVKKLLDPVPEQRFQSAQEALLALPTVENNVREAMMLGELVQLHRPPPPASPAPDPPVAPVQPANSPAPEPEAQVSLPTPTAPLEPGSDQRPTDPLPDPTPVAAGPELPGPRDSPNFSRRLFIAGLLTLMVGMVGASVVLGWLLWDRAGEEGEGPAIEVQQRPPGDGAPEAEEPPPGSVSTGADQENHSVPEAGPITAKALPTREEPDAGPAAEPREAAAKVAPPVPDASPERTPDSPETAPRPPPRDTPQHGIFVANPFDG